MSLFSCWRPAWQIRITKSLLGPIRISGASNGHELTYPPGQSRLHVTAIMNALMGLPDTISLKKESEISPKYPDKSN